jgi:dienelactone hydrolase
MRRQPRSQTEGWIPLIAGLGWLWAGMSGDLLDMLFCLVPGVPLLATGGSKVLWPGDPRIQQFAALGGVLGVAVAIPGLFFIGFLPSLLLGALSAASFVAAGSVSLKQEPRLEDVPEPRLSVSLSAQVAIDEALLAVMQVGMTMPGGEDTDSVQREVAAARELYLAKGWLEKPASYHLDPPPLEAPQIRKREVRLRGGHVQYEHLFFESEYEPHAEEPGRDRWLSNVRNRTAHAWVVRQPTSEPRPWLVCIHGYQMGRAQIDLGVFDPRFLVDRLGLNVIFPVLPLHGPRRRGRRSGDGFMPSNVLDTVHAEAQAMWDIRRLISWARAQGATAVGTHGLSLGGYNAALLAGLEDDLACAIAGIPATDLARLVWRHTPPLQLKYMEHRGVVHDEMAEVLRVVSPLAIEPKVPKKARAIYAGVADRLVPPDQVRDLWTHWDEPDIVWYQGSHVTFMLDPRVRTMVKRVLHESLLGSETAPA